MCGSCLILWFKLDGTSRSISSVTAVRASYGCSTGSRKARPERHQRSIHVTWRPGMGLNTSAAHRRGLRTKTIRPFGNQTLLMPPDSSTAAVSSCAWPNAYTHTHTTRLTRSTPNLHSYVLSPAQSVSSLCPGRAASPWHAATCSPLFLITPVLPARAAVAAPATLFRHKYIPKHKSKRV